MTRFTDNNNDTVTDNLTGLMWAKRSHGIFTEGIMRSKQTRRKPCFEGDMKWLSIKWWHYLFEKRRNPITGRLLTALCRARNHPCGVRWYNPHSLEPDMHCKNCGDDLG